jgi:hypothetical protein
MGHRYEYTYFVRTIQIITEGENRGKVALTLPSYMVMVVVEFRPSVERDEPRRVKREVEPTSDFSGESVYL